MYPCGTRLAKADRNQAVANALRNANVQSIRWDFHAIGPFQFGVKFFNMDERYVAPEYSLVRKGGNDTKRRVLTRKRVHPEEVDGAIRAIRGRNVKTKGRQIMTTDVGACSGGREVGCIRWRRDGR